MNEVQKQNLLAEHADALLRGPRQLKEFLARCGITHEEPLGQLMILAERLYAAMPWVEPSPDFVHQLYLELVGTSDSSVREWWRLPQLERFTLNTAQQQLDRIRQMPLPVQLAAGITLTTITAGVVWIASSRGRREAIRSRLASMTTPPVEKTA